MNKTKPVHYESLDFKFFKTHLAGITIIGITLNNSCGFKQMLHKLRSY